jgi:EAL domain-containing protein (putative c-di-GMP-specific phosphodiesterase class I)
MSLNIVAEGVEEEPQLTKLSAMACDIFQGYYFAKPKDKNDFAKLL